MTDARLRRAAWVLALASLVPLVAAAVLLLLVAEPDRVFWWEPLTKAFATVGAPILGLVIVVRQPRNRYGWLWLAYALSTAVRTLSLAFYFFNHSHLRGYSPLGYVLLWLSEPAGLGTLVCTILLIVWFPDGKLPSHRWRFLHVWLLAAVLLLSQGFFTAGSDWNGAASANAIHIENPFGFIPADAPSLVPFAFLSLLVLIVLAGVALVLRYRSAGYLGRLQIRWFVFGGLLFGVLSVLPVLFIEGASSLFQTILSVIGFAAIVVLYPAVGIAVLRYRLWDIDVIIRRTLVYSVLTGLLALAYFGSIVVLEGLLRSLTGQAQNQLVTVVSTLAIAALFVPLRGRVQAFIDRRFYRRKYDAARTLAAFGASVRDEVEMAALTEHLTAVVQETMQPDQISLWLRPTAGPASQRLRE